MQAKNGIILLALLLAGCGPGTKLGTIAGGECQIVHTPKYEVLGKTHYDNNWIQDTEEALVRGCNQPRPLARPASFDKPKIKLRPKPKPKPVVKTKLPLPRPVTFESVDKAPAPVSVPEPAAPISPPVLQTTPAPELVPVPKRRWWQR